MRAGKCACAYLPHVAWLCKTIHSGALREAAKCRDHTRTRELGGSQQGASTRCARDFDFPTSQRSAVVGNNEIGLTTLATLYLRMCLSVLATGLISPKHAWLCSRLVIFALVTVQTVSGSRSVARDPSAEVERPLRKAFAEMMLSRVW